ncbi:MAG TPA: DUF427 domain-containing protein [Candidatus Saccharimonadales bacterium]|nr:DUF427 domain-containing protein [Candidatus Saccharimonadales bacterium]
MKATWDNQVIAESDQTIVIEGNQYFPPASVKQEFLSASPNHTTCPWKGEASYYSITVDGQTNPDAAWYYPTPKEGSVERVGQDFSNYVAFWKGVTVTP